MLNQRWGNAQIRALQCMARSSSLLSLSQDMSTFCAIYYLDCLIDCLLALIFMPNPGPKHSHCPTSAELVVLWLEDDSSKLQLLLMEDSFRNGRNMVMAMRKFVPAHLCTYCVALIISVQSRFTPDLPLVMIIIKEQRTDIGIKKISMTVLY
jgi:hypothetical protein